MHAQRAAALGVRAFGRDDLLKAGLGRNFHDTHQSTRDMVGPKIRQESSTGSSNSTAPATPLKVKVGFNDKRAKKTTATVDGGGALFGRGQRPFIPYGSRVGRLRTRVRR